MGKKPKIAPGSKALSQKEVNDILMEHNFGGIRSFQNYLRDEGYTTTGSKKLWDSYRPPKDVPKKVLSQQRVKYASPIFNTRPGVAKRKEQGSHTSYSSLIIILKRLSPIH